jgi:hypothetical protein
MIIVSNCAGTPAARVAVAAALLLLGAAATYADTPAADSRVPSQQTREKMAVLHEQLAACLRSDRPVNECRSEMVTNCQAQIGSNCATIAGVIHGTDNRHRMHPLGAPAPATTPNQ